MYSYKATERLAQWLADAERGGDAPYFRACRAALDVLSEASPLFRSWVDQAIEIKLDGEDQP